MTDPMAALRSLFVERCQADLLQLRRFADVGDTDALGAIAHRLAGAAGSFGFPDISVAALAVDQQIRENGAVSGSDMERLLALLGEIPSPTRAESRGLRESGD